MKPMNDKKTVRQEVNMAVRAQKKQREAAKMLAAVAAVVVFAVVLLVMQKGSAQTHTERVLDCPVTETVAHAHNESCYDAEGNLVCTLPELELHTHTDECYATESVLVCGLEEGEEHQHTDECYETATTLICEQEEISTVHEHGPGCFQELVMDEEGNATIDPTLPAQTFESDVKNADGDLQLKLSVDAPEGALPQGTEMKAELVEQQNVDQELVQQAVSETAEGKVLDYQAVNITFVDEAGAEVEPARDVTVTLTSNLISTDDETVVVHVENEREAQTRAQDMGLAEYQIEADVVQQLSEPELNTREMALGGDQLAFDAGTGTTFVLANTSLRHQMTSSSGKSVVVTVDAPAQAGIPQDATLQVVEIDADAPEYQEYVAQSAQAIDASVDELDYVGLFDIQILSAAGEKIEPAESVQVKIEYVEPVAYGAPENMQVVHFGEQGTEVIAPTTSTSDDGVVEEMTFETSSFSLYSIVSSGATTDLGGKTYALINTYSKVAMQDEALTNKKLMGITYLTSGNEIRTDGVDMTLWTFTLVSGNKYYIQNEEGQYLNVTGSGNSGTVTVSDTPQELIVTVGSGTRAGKVRITNGQTAINNYSGSAAEGFGTYNDSGNNEWFTLHEMEEYGEFAAEKISVQDVDDGEQVVIYKSVYNEATERYEDYAIDGNGNLVKAYDKGDQLIGYSKVSPYWEVIFGRDASGQPNGYYIIQNVETGLCLCPQADGTLVAEFESETTSGVTLNGRQDGAYISTIEKWDNSAWAWYGYQITSSEGNVTLESATRADSQELSFASILNSEEGKLHTVKTVDSASAGITIHMFDYPNRNTIAGVTGSDGYAVGVLPANHVKPVLVDGYPVFKNNQSGSTLFQPSGSYYKGDGNYLFLESVFNSTGYYEYNAFNNFAHYNSNNDTFTVYQEIGTPSDSNNFFYKRGNFLPFNDLDPKKKASNTNQYDGNAHELDFEDPAKGDMLYKIDNTNFYFGMTIEATFMQPKDGIDKGGPVVYEFNGDDDLWVFVDNVLLLDIGGVHDAWPGSINFATGEITLVDSQKDGQGKPRGATTIKAAFKEAGIFPDGTTWDDSKVDQYFKGNTFIDYSSHTFKMFYMEHGAGASNLEVRFNLPVIEKGKFTVEKQLDGTSQQKYANVYFAYQAFQKGEDGSDVPLTSAVYEGTTNPVRFYDDVEINGNTYDNVFYLKPGEAATFAEMPEDTQYYVQELGVGTDYYDTVIVNDVKIDGQDVTPKDGVYPTTVATVENRARVTYSNHCSEKNLNDLRITKQLAVGNVDDGATFEFRVQLENADGVLAPYSVGDYYVQDADGDYYRYVDGKLVNNGKTPVVASVSGQNGTIAGIPAGFTVVIKNLLADTDFHVEEIRNPAGWELQSKTLEEGTYATSTLEGTDWSGNEIVADGQIILNHDAEVTITNKGNKRLVVNKVWKSGDLVTQHGNITVALFTRGDGGELTFVKGSVKTLEAPATSLTYEISDLTNIVVREVVVSGSTVTPVDEGEKLAVSGENTQVGDGLTDTYIATYQQGEIKTTDDEGNEIVPQRTDTITNTMASLTVNKTDINNAQLAGATFSLLKEDKKTAVPGYESFTSTDAKSGNLLSEVRLPNGTYYLVETDAPAGYVPLEHMLKIVVDTDGISMKTDDTVAKIYTDQTATNNLVYTFSVANNTGVALPMTGGTGTWPMMAAGMMLVLAGAVLFGRRLRMMF